MLDLLTDLADHIKHLPAGAVLDDALRADLIRRIMAVGQGAPQAAAGSGYDELRESLTGPGGRYPTPAGPYEPPPPPPPPAAPGDDD